MSYILEALKKSEQERKRGDVPDLQTLHFPGPDLPKTRNWPYVVIVSLLVTLAFVIGWMLPDQQSVTQADIPSTKDSQAEVLVRQSVQTEQAPVPVKQPATAPALLVQSSPPRPAAFAPASPVKVERPVPKVEPPSLDISSVPHLSEMPQLVQQALPNMSFAGHVYSSNAGQRSVIINGRSMTEGDQLLQGLVVEQITASGIIFNYQGRLFRMDILQDLSFDY
jgi:general secretion pathway protein B